MIPEILRQEVEAMLSAQTGSHAQIRNARPLGGGSINEAYYFEVERQPYFIKWNSSSRYPGMFEAEASGLQLLSSANAVRVPTVLGFGSCGQYAFLLLEYIEPGRAGANSWKHFGQQLAVLHRRTDLLFGLGSDNYIGSLFQTNAPRRHRWCDFFVECRLMPQLQMATSRGLIGSSMQRQFERLFTRMDQFFPEEPPALLHGDLWSGNYMFDAYSCPVIFDPAVYYGHREMDLAMTFLFGGFDGRFYDAYNEAWPLEKAWRSRIDLCNLYPLLVHVNLFGGGYVRQVRSVLDRFA